MAKTLPQIENGLIVVTSCIQPWFSTPFFQPEAWWKGGEEGRRGTCFVLGQCFKEITIFVGTRYTEKNSFRLPAYESFIFTPRPSFSIELTQIWTADKVRTNRKLSSCAQP